MEEGRDPPPNDSPATILPVLDRFMTIIAPLFRKDNNLTQWSVFRGLLAEQPLNYSKVYSELSRIQRGVSITEDLPHQKIPSRKDSNAYWDDYSNEYSNVQPVSKKKASSVYRQLQEASTKQPSKQGSNVYSINAEYSLKQQRSRSRYCESRLKESRQQLAPSMSNSKLNRELGLEPNYYTTMCMVDYVKEEGAKLTTSKPELLRTLTNSSVIKCNMITEQLSILAVGFFVVLLKEAHDDNSQTAVSIWEVYNRVVKQAFTYTNADDCDVFLRVLARLLSKKYAADSQRRVRSFLQQVLSDNALLHIVERIYKETIQERKLADGQQSTRKVSYSSRKEQPGKGTTVNTAYVENCKDFARVCMLRVYSVRDGNLIFENYGQEEQSHSRLSIIKKNNNFFLIVEEQSEYAGAVEQTTARTMEYSKSFKNIEKGLRFDENKEVASPQLETKRTERILSNTQSIRKESNRHTDLRYERIASKINASQGLGERPSEEQPLSVARIKDRDDGRATDEKIILTNRLDRLISRLKSNNSTINGLVKDDQKYQPLKSPLVSLYDVYPLTGGTDNSRERIGQTK